VSFPFCPSTLSNALGDRIEAYWEHWARREGATRQARRRTWKQTFLDLYFGRCRGCSGTKELSAFDLLPLEPKGIQVCETCCKTDRRFLVVPLEVAKGGLEDSATIASFLTQKRKVWIQSEAPTGGRWLNGGAMMDTVLLSSFQAARKAWRATWDQKIDLLGPRLANEATTFRAAAEAVWGTNIKSRLKPLVHSILGKAPSAVSSEALADAVGLWKGLEKVERFVQQEPNPAWLTDFLSQPVNGRPPTGARAPYWRDLLADGDLLYSSVAAFVDARAALHDQTNARLQEIADEDVRFAQQQVRLSLLLPGSFHPLW
jgi:hypothetical protein